MVLTTDENEENEFADANENPPIAGLIFNLYIQNRSQQAADNHSEDDEYSEDEYDQSVQINTKRHCNKQQPTEKTLEYQPQNNTLQKYMNKINLEKYAGPTMSSEAVSHLIQNDKKEDNNRKRIKDKSDRATEQNALDGRTLLILAKWIRQEHIQSVYGCISTGKEANVYFAPNADGKHFAAKVFKTSILDFKDRSQYIDGDHRFHRFSKNNRKMVALWAEKENRNLARLERAGIFAPRSYRQRANIILMDFIGTNGWPAPKLKDAELTEDVARQLYRDVVVIMWKMFNKCNLIHADLSEFNMLYHNGEICVIDVSQSVQSDHKSWRDFLINDCKNVTNFFKKNGVGTMSIKDLHNFITDRSINDGNMEQCLDRLAEKTAEVGYGVDEVDEEVFKKSFVPSRLDEVLNYERDINLVKSGVAVELNYTHLVGLKSDLSGTIEQPEILEERLLPGLAEQENEEISENETNAHSSSDESEEEGSKFKDCSRPKHESLDDKKARKKAAKEAQAVKRQTKRPKYLKKQKENRSRK